MKRYIGDNVSNINKPLIMSAREGMLSWSELKPILSGLQSAITDCDQTRIRGFLIQAVPRFKSQCNIDNVLYKERL